ncbi:MAG: LacI family DNA-binding transcriptional regulator [Acetivibrionales bacterium]
MPITIRDVAKLSGVSTATVSHVINNTRFVSEETRSKVDAAIRQLGYVMNINAQGLRSNVSHRIGLLVPEISAYFPVDIIEPIENVLLKKGYQLVLGYTHDNIELERIQIQNFNYQQIDGLLMFPAIGDHSYLKDMKLNYPIVFLDRKAKNFEADCVMADDKKAAYDGISMLIEAGHQSIGIIIGNRGISTTQARYIGYENALRDHGILVDPALIKYGNSESQGGYDKTQELLNEGKMTALFPSNIMMTIGALNV